MPQLIIIPALRDITDATKISKNELLGRLLLPLLVESEGEKPEAIKKTIRELKKEINNKIKDISLDTLFFLKKQSPEIKELSIICENILIEKAIETRIELKDIFNQDCAIERRGCGHQSSLILAMMQTYAKRRIGPNFIIAIEEPELFLHVGAQRIMFHALKNISKSGSKVFISTHSPIFIDRNEPEAILILKRDGFESELKQCTNLKKEICDQLEIKFSDVLGWNCIVFCEGKRDQKLISIFSKKLGVNLDELYVNVIRLGTKNYMSYFAEGKVLKEFGIPFVILLDKDTKDTEEIKRKLLGQNTLPPDRIFVTNKREIENYLSKRAIGVIHGIDKERQLKITDDCDVKELIERETGTSLKYEEIAEEMTSEEIHEDIKKIIEKVKELAA